MLKDYNTFMSNAKENLDTMIDNLKSVPVLHIDSLSAEHTMEVIIDMNNGFAKSGALYSDRVEQIIPSTERLTRECAKRGIEIVALSDSHPKGAPELDSYPEHCMEGTDEVELVNELKNIEGIKLINKNSTNGFFSFLPHIKDKNINTFIITGCVTDICIYQFTITLKAFFNEHNKRVRIIVPIDCVETFDIPKIHDAELMNIIFLNSLLANGVEVVKSINT